jgi:hypothetical protein
MTKTDPALEAIRKVRREISREFDNDPARLIEHYMELQRGMQPSRLVQGPDDGRVAPTPSTEMLPNSDVAADAALSRCAASGPRS